MSSSQLPVYLLVYYLSHEQQGSACTATLQLCERVLRDPNDCTFVRASQRGFNRQDLHSASGIQLDLLSRLYY